MEKILITEAELSEQLGLSRSFLQKDRVGARLIPFIKIGGTYRYNPDQVRVAMLAMQQGGDATPRQKAGREAQQ